MTSICCEGCAKRKYCPKDAPDELVFCYVWEDQTDGGERDGTTAMQILRSSTD